jgi:glycolate oxidase FAD binding subunit
MTALSDASLTKLESLVDAEDFSADAFTLENYSIDGTAPRASVAARSAEQVEEILRFAAAEELAIVPVGNASQLHLGMPPARYDVALRIVFSELISFDPGDLTLSVGAGHQLNLLNQQLAAHGQFLPMDTYSGGNNSVGGALAVNASGPLRHAYGTARDFLLGLEFVTGEGVRTKSGSRVVKSVSGYDIHKLHIGALGTLGVITSANFRTFPLPPARATFLFRFRDAAGALALRRTIAQSNLQPRALDILSPEAAALLSKSEKSKAAALEIPEMPLEDFTTELSAEAMQQYKDLTRQAGDMARRATASRVPAPEFSTTEWTVLVAAGGNERVVERHCRELEQLAAAHSATNFAEAKAIPKPLDKLYGIDCFEWHWVRSFPGLANPLISAGVMMKCNVLPSNFAALLEGVARVAGEFSLQQATLLRAAGVVYVLLDAEQSEPPLGVYSAACSALFAVVAQLGGTAVVESCPASLKKHVNVWGSFAPGPLALMRALKKEFDPKGILSPGRFVGGL